MAQKKCHHCGEWKDEEEYSWRWKSLGIRNKACKKCMYEFNKNYYQGDAHERHLQQVKERTEAAVQPEKNTFTNTFLLILANSAGNPILEFWNSTTETPVGKHMLSGGYSIKRIQAEIEKCDVLCANCHRKITVEERGWFRSKR